MEVADSQFLSEINLRVTRNKENGKSLREGITDPEYERFLAILRPNRQSASSTATKTGGKKKVEPMADNDILNLFK